MDLHYQELKKFINTDLSGLAKFDYEPSHEELAAFDEWLDSMHDEQYYDEMAKYYGKSNDSFEFQVIIGPMTFQINECDSGFEWRSETTNGTYWVANFKTLWKEINQEYDSAIKFFEGIQESHYCDIHTYESLTWIDDGEF